MMTAPRCENGKRSVRILPPGAALAALSALPRSAAAQGGSGSAAGLAALSQPDFLLYAVLALVLVIGFILAVIILKKLNLGRSSDTLQGLTYLDVTSLKKTGLLTEEEAARVRASMQKQVERHRHAAGRPAVSGELGLLADPEVQRLEAEAEARQRMRDSALRPVAAGQAATPSAPSPAAAGAQPASARPVFSPRGAASSPGGTALSAGQSDEDPELGMMGAPVRTAPPAVSVTPVPGEDVPLPPDVLKMAELGLITPDELERIKARIREKRQGL